MSEQWEALRPPSPHGPAFLHDDTCDVCLAHRQAVQEVRVLARIRTEEAVAAARRERPRYNRADPAVTASHQASTAARVAGELAALGRWGHSSDAALAWVEFAIPRIYQAIRDAARGIPRSKDALE